MDRPVNMVWTEKVQVCDGHDGDDIGGNRIVVAMHLFNLCYFQECTVCLGCCKN